MSQANIDYLLKHNAYLNREKVELFPNTIKVLPPKSKPNHFKTRKKLGIPEDKTIFVFGGNIGVPQGVYFLVECIDELRDYEQAYFLIVGDGTERTNIEATITQRKLNNVMIRERLLNDDYDKLIQECDVELDYETALRQLMDYCMILLNYVPKELAISVSRQLIYCITSQPCYIQRLFSNSTTQAE